MRYLGEFRSWQRNSYQPAIDATPEYDTCHQRVAKADADAVVYVPLLINYSSIQLPLRSTRLASATN